MKSHIVEAHHFSTASEFLEQLAHALELYDAREAFVVGAGGELFDGFQILATDLGDGSIVYDVVLKERKVGERP